MHYRKDEVLKVVYMALSKTGGLTDLTLRVYNPSNDLVNTITMTEVSEGSGIGGGLYTGSFTPTVAGQYRIRIDSAINSDDFAKVYEIANLDLDDVKTELDLIDGKIDVIGTDVDTALLDLISIEGKVDTANTNIGLIKTKTDNLPVDTATTLAAIKAVVDSIELQVNAGGYIL